MNLAQLTALTEDQAREYLESIRWPGGAICPHCGGDKTAKLQGKATRPGVYKCKNRECRKQFTITVGTIMERSHIKLRHWIIAFHLMCSSKKGVSAHQIHRELGITYKSAWFMCHRIRYAMTQEPLAGMLNGTVEVDETYVGGKSRRGIPGRGSERKTPVVALVERDGSVRSKPVASVGATTLKKAIRDNVDRAATIMTDEWSGYKGLDREFAGHEVVKHSAGEYVRGNVYTNTAESYFALLKRGVHGIFHHVSETHLRRYCDEFSFRWCQRKVDDGSRTIAAIRGSGGKRLTYKEPVGRNALEASKRRPQGLVGDD
ncbi:MAG: IS1595 family transposase [Acidiferrobacterales bacterium]